MPLEVDSSLLCHCRVTEGGVTTTIQMAGEMMEKYKTPPRGKGWGWDELGDWD